MNDLLLPLIFFFVPFLILFYMAAEIHARDGKSILHRWTALQVFTYALMALSVFLIQVLPQNLAPLAAKYIGGSSWFVNILAGFFFLQAFCKFRIPPVLIWGGVLGSLIGLFGLLAGWAGFEVSVSSGPVWRAIERGDGIYALLSSLSGYSTIVTLICYWIAYRKLKSKPWAVHERRRIKLFLITIVVMMTWIGLIMLLQDRLGLSPYISSDLITMYSIFAYVGALRYAMVNYGFLSTGGRRYEILFQDAADGILICDENWRYMDANPAYLRMIGIVDQADKSWEGASSTDYVYLDNILTEEQIIQARKESNTLQTQSRLTNRLQQSYDIVVQTHFFEMEGQIWSFNIIKDITAQKEYEQKLAYMAYHDPLTRLNNRRRFYEKLVEELRRMDGTDGKLAVMLIDLDQFKWINDTLGHFAGDKLLILVAERLKAVVPENGCIARMGGDEFVVLMSGLHSDYETEELARQIIIEMRKPFTIDSRPFQVTTSVGISVAPRDGTDAETIVRCADTAMYAAKKAGRDQFMKYLPTQRVAAEQALVLVNGLKTALESDEFSLYYQPQFDLGTSRLIGVEALLRWNSVELGSVSPADFIPIAEETGAIVSIGDWVLRTAIIQGKKWMVSGHSDLVMSVNLSASQLRDPQLSFRLADILRENDYPASNLCLEITESTAIWNLEQTLLVCSEIVGLGVSLSIDDFGTGYSSLGMLSRFPFQTVKIDKSLIRDIEINRKDAAIIQAIVQLSSHMEMDVLAEGVETEAQLKILKDFGCHQVQGYLCGRPMPSGEIDMMLEQRRQTRQF